MAIKDQIKIYFPFPPGLDEISKKIRTTPDLLDLSHSLDLAASDIMQVMSTSLSFPPTLIRHIVLQMLQKWVRLGGTRQRLLEIAQAFHFNDAADEIAIGKCSLHYSAESLIIKKTL